MPIAVEEMLFSTRRQRLSGDWDVCPVPLYVPLSPLDLTFADALSVPECSHLQPFLYPDQAYWGEHLRSINDYAWAYRRTFVTPIAAPDHRQFRRARLAFEGVDYFAEVWLNGCWLGRHEGHFAPFTFDATAALRPPGHDNELTVYVTAPWDRPNPKGVYPSDHVLRGLVKGLYEHGEGVIPPNVNPIGIWRPVWLITDAGVSIDHVRIRTDLDGNVALRFTLTNATNGVWRGSLCSEILPENHEGSGASARVDLNIRPGQHQVDVSLRVDQPRLWWPWDHGYPNLYALHCQLTDPDTGVISSSQELFGFRTVRLERSPERFVYVTNERPVFVRGVSYMPGLYLSQYDEAALSRDVALVKDAHLNLLRVHVHVSPPELYDVCDREGMLIWQDFELNWVHDPSPDFEARARVLQREMISLLGNHPSIITWSCHNEPTMVFTRRHNLEQRPDPALYADAVAQDPTRPVFLCSGQMDNDWERSGDTHTYYGAIWSNNYTDVYRLRSRLSTEFGFEAPAASATLKAYPDCWERLQHLDGQIESIWAYQADLIQYHVEHFRRLRASSCAGYIHFWLVDLVPQVGCGVLDAHRLPKGGYEALCRASQPLHAALEHDGRKARALWIFNDTMQTYPRCTLRWRVFDASHALVFDGCVVWDVAANASQQVTSLRWSIDAERYAEVELTLFDQAGNPLTVNRYRYPFRPKRRPKGYPWKFDFVLGTKVFDRTDAPSLAETNSRGVVNLIPLIVRERGIEWVLRQRLPHRLVSLAARLVDVIG